MKILFELYITFFKIGAFTFGGGYAMLPLLQRELVDKRKRITEEEILDYYAIGQTTPGIIAVNTSTFCGRKRKGNLGGIFGIYHSINSNYYSYSKLFKYFFPYNFDPKRLFWN